eukprot:TRINITY_DN3288_c0_g1_i4.p5 TRINITY_DN3288_c0_g1~~TRINITY_DN3288_c0_g1_i4.p5  ORF type:complete len:170 (+),score=46.88 TRINITY_DN3288_c0_g1_i4:677-1186(+)
MGDELSKKRESKGNNPQKERSVTTQNQGSQKFSAIDRQVESSCSTLDKGRQIRKEQQKIQKDKITWDKLENITFKDLNRIIFQRGEKQFNPSVLFEEQENEEDKYYLEEYQLEGKNGKISLSKPEKNPKTSRKDKSHNVDSQKKNIRKLKASYDDTCLLYTSPSPRDQA